MEKFTPDERKKLGIPLEIDETHLVAAYILTIGKMNRRSLKGCLDKVVSMLAPDETIWTYHWGLTRDDLNRITINTSDSANVLDEYLRQKNVDKHVNAVKGLMKFIGVEIDDQRNVAAVPLNVHLNAMLAMCDKDTRLGKKSGIRDAAVLVLLAAGFAYEEVAGLQRADYVVDERVLQNRTVEEAVHTRLVSWLSMRAGIKGKSMFLYVASHNALSNQALTISDIDAIVTKRFKQTDVQRNSA